MLILKVSKSNSREKIEFELKYLKSLATKQGFQMMFKKTEEIRNLLENRGYRKTQCRKDIKEQFLKNGKFACRFSSD